MQRRAWMLAIIGIALVALIGLIITFGVSQKEEQPPVSGEQAAGEAGEAGEAPSAGVLGKAAALEFRRLEVDTSKIEAEACLVFTAHSVEAGKTKYGDYLKFDPETQMDIRVRQIAFASGVSTLVKLSADAPRRPDCGLGRRLSEAETLPVELEDRPPIVVFEGGFVLPRENGTVFRSRRSTSTSSTSRSCVSATVCCRNSARASSMSRPSMATTARP